MSKKIILSIIMVILLTCAFVMVINAAEYTDEKGIKYTINPSDKTAQVANNTAFTGTEAIISGKIIVDGVEYTVTSVASSAFKGNSYVTTIYFPSTITVYNSHTITQADNLTAVYIDFSNVTSIGTLGMTNGSDSKGYKVANPNVVFYPTSEYGKEKPTPMYTLELKSLKTLGDAAFQCSSPTELVFDCLDKIPTQCFRGSNFEKVTLKGPITVINGYSFDICKKLKTVIVESDVLSEVGGSAFCNCANMESFTIEMSNVTKVNGNSFWFMGEKGKNSKAIWYNLKGERLVDLSAIKLIAGNYAFAGSNIGSAKVIFPTALEQSTLGSATTTDSGCFRNAGLTGTVYIDAADGYALFVDSWAFRGNDIDTVIFGKNVKSVNQCFKDMTTLKTVVFLADEVEAKNKDMFQNCSGIDFYFKSLTTNTEFSQANEIVISDGSYVRYGACGFITTVVVNETQETVTFGKVEHTTVSAIDNSFCPIGKVTVTKCRFCEYEEYTLDGETITPNVHDFDTANGATVTNRVYVDYFALGFNIITCADCEATKTEDEASAPAIFTYYGYSCTEEAIGGVYSMSQFYGVNNDALEAYKAYTGKNFAYGLVASGSANPLSIVEGELTVADKAFIKDSATFAHNFFGIKINGMTEDNTATPIVFCAYVVDGDEISYLDNDTTTKTVAGITYESVLVIVNTPTVKEDAE